MQLDAEDLLNQIQADWPGEYELSQLRCLARHLDEENQQLRQQVDRLTAPADPATGVSPVRPYIDALDGEGGRHGG